MNSTAVISHRGYHHVAAENSLEAFEQAVSMGVDGIETDVRMSADGLPILFHDRVAPDGREVATLSRGQLSEIAGYSVATLDVALETFEDILWNIEVKTPLALDTTKTIVRRYASSRRILITSFWHDLLEEFVEIPSVECGILIAHHPFRDQTAPALLSNKRIRTIVMDYEVLDATFIQSAESHNIRSLVYGAKTWDEHHHCIRSGVHGIITDNPSLALEMTGARAAEWS
jgi:glycerophosphoryl diester phosphodiesterase